MISYILLILISLTSVKASEMKVLYKKNDWMGLRSLVLSKNITVRRRMAYFKSLDRLATTKAICESQLEQQSLPTNCYKLLELERGWGFISFKEQIKVVGQLDELCSAVAANLRKLEDPRFRTLGKKNLSPKCRTMLLEARTKSEYISREQGPRVLFQQRLQ